MRAITTLRSEIDKLDRDLVQLISKRLELIKEVGEFKKRSNIPSLAPERWQQVLESKKLLAQELNISENLIEEIYELIHEHALTIEDEIKSKE